MLAQLFYVWASMSLAFFWTLWSWLFGTLVIQRIASIYVIYQCWCERKDAIDGIYGTTVTRPPIAQPSSVISSSIPPVARSASRVSNRPPANMEKDENGY